MDTTAVLVAPWVEEAAKGAAVLLVLLFRRREFDGVVDGIVLAGLSGLGFAFTENVLYFGRAFLAGQEQSLTTGFFAVGFTFVLRGVLSPFAHPLFTAMTGIGLGIAARTNNPTTRIAGAAGRLPAGRGAARLLEPVVAVRAVRLLHRLRPDHGAGVRADRRRRDLVPPPGGRDRGGSAPDVRGGGLARPAGRADARVAAAATAGGRLGRGTVRRRRAPGRCASSSTPRPSSPSCATGWSAAWTCPTSRPASASC